MSELDDLPTRAREADPGDRINLRDPIAAHGELAVEGPRTGAVNSGPEPNADPSSAVFRWMALDRPIAMSMRSRSSSDVQQMPSGGSGATAPPISEADWHRPRARPRMVWLDRHGPHR